MIRSRRELMTIRSMVVTVMTRSMPAPGDDLIDGGFGDDAISGGAGNDIIYGDDGSDTITAGSGDDTIDGGAGNDTAIFNGDKDDFTFSVASDGTLTVSDANSTTSLGIDTLNNIEVLEFNDGDLAIDMSSTGYVTLTGSDADDVITVGHGVSSGLKAGVLHKHRCQRKLRGGHSLYHAHRCDD